ncbi:MAG: DUF5318 family protein [Actinomycetota bacterium]
MTGEPSRSARTRPGGRSDDATGVVSYRLARQRLVEAHARGHRTDEEVCDAQPELRRVAHSCGVPANEPCPICDADDLVTVAFAFGSGLPKAGRVVASLAEMQKLRTRGKPATCYLVEVCTSCWWNHLRESYGIPARR